MNFHKFVTKIKNYLYLTGGVLAQPFKARLTTKKKIAHSFIVTALFVDLH